MMTIFWDNKGPVLVHFQERGATLPTSAPNTTGCHQGYQRFQNSCYKFFEDPLNWTSAESACQKDGGNLATLNSGIEQAFVEIVVQGVQTDITQIWIGLKFNIASAAFAWADGWPVRYTNWGDNEPDMKNNGYCVTHTVDDQWQVSPCVMELSYVCEINFGTPPPPRSFNGTGRCPDNTWSRHNGYCYHIETSTPSTWGEANAACRQLGANLTSIHTDAESRYLTNLIGSVLKDVWIGLYKGLGTGFTWYDGTETEYTYWAVGEPNDPDPYLHQDCVKILGRYGTWADTDCSDKNAYICKMPQRANATYPTRRPGQNQSRPRSRPSLGPNATYPSRRTRHNQSPSPAVALGQSGTTDSGLGGGAVAGVVIGVLFLVLLCVAIGVVLLRYTQGKSLLPFSLQKLQSALPGVTNVSYDSKRDDKVNLSSDA